MRLPLFNQLLLTPLAFQIQRLNWIQSQEKELPEGAAPSRRMHGLKGWDNTGRGGQEALGDDPTFPCPKEIPSLLIPLLPTQQHSDPLEPIGIWFFPPVSSSSQHQTPEPETTFLVLGVPPASHHAASSLNHGMIHVGSDPKAPLFSIPSKLNHGTGGKNQGIKTAKWRGRSVPASPTSKLGDPELWNNNGSSVTWQDLESFLFQEQWIWHWNSAAFLSKGIKCPWQRCQRRFSATR